ncbi:hypothetical protein [Halobiforma nitratireducens]|uniref:Uncharacterized protein n=1 Tax=Halobiforma nitratireducens JCM 10879 TaxID=1227454 RepID=M0LE61_9EURY|nr:hypothetical protein [Halobiforma nitratireducens]EMA31398.1 hypothetical protein C446_15563 [Halobiforma nitratireducens JCM 10879]
MPSPDLLAHLLPLLVVLFLPVAGLCLAYAIARDAETREANGTGWAAFVVLLPPIAVPVYLLYRRRLPARHEPAGPRERWVGSIGIAGVTGFLAVGLGMPPDPFTLALYVPVAVVVLMPVAYLLCYEPGWRTLGT